MFTSQRFIIIFWIMMICYELATCDPQMSSLEKIYVSRKHGNDNSGDGSKHNPYQNIQFAIDRAVANAIITIDPDEYQLDTGINVLGTLNLTLTSAPFWDGDTPTTTFSTIRMERFARSILLRIDRSNSTSINNIIFSGGWDTQRSGGVIITRSNKVSFENCVFTQSAGLMGGAVFIGSSKNITFTECSFSNNQALLENKRIETVLTQTASQQQQFSIIGTQFLSNFPSYTLDEYETGYGGAIFLNDSSVIFDGTEFSNNSALIGGILAVQRSAVSIKRTRISDNKAYLQGSVLFAFDKASSFNISNSEFMNNYCTNIKCQVIYANHWQTGWSFQEYFPEIDEITQISTVVCIGIVIFSALCQLIWVSIVRFLFGDFKKRAEKRIQELQPSIKYDDPVKYPWDQQISLFNQLIYEWFFGSCGIYYPPEVFLVWRFCHSFCIYAFLFLGFINKFAQLTLYPEFAYDTFDYFRTISYNIEKSFLYLIPLITHCSMEIFTHHAVKSVIMPTNANVILLIICLMVASLIGTILAYLVYHFQYFMSIYWFFISHNAVMVLFLSYLVSQHLRSILNDFFLSIRKKSQYADFTAEIEIYNFVAMKKRMKQINHRSWVLILPFVVMTLALLINSIFYTLIGVRVISYHNESMTERILYISAYIIIMVAQLFLMAYVTLSSVIWERRVEHFMCNGVRDNTLRQANTKQHEKQSTLKTHTSTPLSRKQTKSQLRLHNIITNQDFDDDSSSSDDDDTRMKAMLGMTEFNHIMHTTIHESGQFNHKQSIQYLNQMSLFVLYIRRKFFIYRLPFSVDLFMRNLITWVSLFISIIAVTKVLQRSFEEDLFLI